MAFGLLNTGRIKENGDIIEIINGAACIGLYQKEYGIGIMQA